MPARTVVVATGAANLASVLAALQRAGQSAIVTRDASRVADAELVVLPGVGSFGSAALALQRGGLDEALRERIAAGAPLLGICLGMQLFAESSEESEGARGLGVISGVARRFPRRAGVRVPQFGWNRVTAADTQGPLSETGEAYFAHSYRLTSAPMGWQVAWADHGGRFVAALARGRVVGCQFHPELSAGFGSRLLQRWIAGREIAEEVQL